ncbi:DUF4224 domain-containing protein [Pseudohongiella nitratireducens]|mgnify:CR=1 FL=1|uniref:DUF4224 domain-containing protein n=1 Tax=Pseudohongiella nitratireducens TaxID=1768907 RepID=UPI0030EBA701|tara:strand:+ start:5577 stop:5801 length:225 start_codon:yes stop_codon:yes gene_type:complete
MSQNLLDNDEVKQLTGYSRPAKQAQWLSSRGVKHYINANGEVVVPAVALLRPLHESGNTEPDFGALFDGGKKSA